MNVNVNVNAERYGMMSTPPETYGYIDFFRVVNILSNVTDSCDNESKDNIALQVTAYNYKQLVAEAHGSRRASTPLMQGLNHAFIDSNLSSIKMRWLLSWMIFVVL